MSKQSKEEEEKNIYVARQGAPFKKEDVQEIGKFIEKCKDKSTRGILKEVKKHPESKIHSYIEWDIKKGSELYQLSRIREIVNHIEIEIIRFGNNDPVDLDVSISAFKSVCPEGSKDRIYVSVEEGMTNEHYREQIVSRAKVELKNWMERYEQYDELSKIIDALDEFKSDLS